MAVDTEALRRLTSKPVRSMEGVDVFRLKLEAKYALEEIDYLKLLLISDVKSRVVGYLLKHSKESPLVVVTQYELAVESGSSRETVARVIHDLTEQGVIRSPKRGEIEIIDRERLHGLLDNKLDRFLGYPEQYSSPMMDAVTRAIVNLGEAE